MKHNAFVCSPSRVAFRLGRQTVSRQTTADSSGENTPARPKLWKRDNPKTIIRWFHRHCAEVLVYTESAPFCSYLEAQGFSPVAVHPTAKEYRIPREAFSVLAASRQADGPALPED